MLSFLALTAQQANFHLQIDCIKKKKTTIYELFCLLHKLLARMHLVLFIFGLNKYYLNSTEWSDANHQTLPLHV